MLCACARYRTLCTKVNESDGGGRSGCCVAPSCQINHTTQPPMMTNMMVMSVYSSPPFFRHVPHSLQGYIFGGGHMLRMITG